MSKRSIVLTLAALLGVGAIGLAGGQQEPPETTRDHETYAADFGISLPEAVERLDWQTQVADLREEIGTIAPGRLAGLGIVHGADFKAVVRLKGTQEHKRIEQAASQMPFPVEIQTGFKYTNPELDIILDKVIRSLPPGDTSGYVDELTGTAILEVVEGSQTAGRLPELEAELRARYPDVTFDTQVIPNDRSVATSSAYAGWKMLDVDFNFRCTAGWAIWDWIGGQGLLTAGHCFNSLYYYETGPYAYGTQYTWGYNDAAHDVQYNKVIALQEEGYFWDGYSKRPVRNQWSDSAQVAQYACAFGWTTGYRCGWVQSTTYNPGGSYPTMCGGWCGPYWGYIPGVDTQGGDSGGPVFKVDSAFGIVTARNSATTIYMPIARVNGKGVYLFFAP